MPSRTTLYLAGLSILFSVIIFASCSENSGTNNNNGGTLSPAELLPASNEISGWVKGTDTGDYGEADDLESLEALIDGAAELYIQYGFVEGVFQIYNGTIGNEVEAEVYIGDHGSEGNTAAIFDDENLIPGNLTPWEAGDEAVIDETALSYIIIHAREGKYYIRVQVGKGNDDTIALLTAEQFITTIINEIS